MITLRSLPMGAMGPAPHHNPYRHEKQEEPRRRVRSAARRLVPRDAGAPVVPALPAAPMVPVPGVPAEGGPVLLEP